MANNLVTTWYLHYQGPKQDLPTWPSDALLMEARIPSPELSQFLFSAVGNHWLWFSRLQWDYQQWLTYLCSENVRTWVLYQEGTIAGFIELCYHQSSAKSTDVASVELKFFGLLPAFIGRGLGPKLAQAAIALAQEWLIARAPASNGNSVWVHTCSADHPGALATYQRAGFVIYQTEQQHEDMPENYLEAALCRSFISSRLTYFK